MYNLTIKSHYFNVIIKVGFEVETTISNLQVHPHQWDRRTVNVI